MSMIYVDDVEVELNKKNIKGIYLSVHPPYGKVKLSVPLKMNDEDIKAFIISKLPWIMRQKERFVAQGKLPEEEFTSGEFHYYFGRRLILNVIYLDKGPSRVELRDNKYIDLYVKQGDSRERKEKILNEWYRRELKDRIPPLIKKWEKEMGVKVNAWGVKRMKSRWGSCNVLDKRIWINLELAKKPLHCLEYIVVHEMAHLLERGHGKRFIAVMNRFLPDWRTIKAELNGLKPYE